MPKKRFSTKDKAILGIIGAIIIALIYQTPTWYEAWKERPLVDISLGSLDPEYPKKELQNDASHYYVDIIAENRGHNDGKIILIVNGTRVKVSFNEDGPWQYGQSVPFTVFPHPAKET